MLTMIHKLYYALYDWLRAIVKQSFNFLRLKAPSRIIQQSNNTKSFEMTEVLLFLNEEYVQTHILDELKSDVYIV